MTEQEQREKPAYCQGCLAAQRRTGQHAVCMVDKTVAEVNANYRASAGTPITSDRLREARAVVSATRQRAIQNNCPRSEVVWLREGITSVRLPVQPGSPIVSAPQDPAAAYMSERRDEAIRTHQRTLGLRPKNGSR